MKLMPEELKPTVEEWIELIEGSRRHQINNGGSPYMNPRQPPCSNYDGDEDEN